MTMIAAFDAIPNRGTDIRLFRRKDRYDLYGRSHMRSNTDDYDANFGDEEYEDDEMNNSRHGHKKWWIPFGVAMALLGWLIVFPWIKLGNYSQAVNFTTVEVITIQKTHNRQTEYNVTATVAGFNSRTPQLMHTLHGDVIVVKLNMIKFLGSSKGYQLGEVTGQSTNVASEQSFPGSDNSFQLGNETDNYLTIVQNMPWAEPTVAVSPCTVQLGPINDFNSHSYNILVSPDGRCLAHQLS